MERTDEVVVVKTTLPFLFFLLWQKGKGKGRLFNIGDQTGKDCLLTWADGVKIR